MTCTAAIAIGYIVCQTQWGQVIKPASMAEYAEPVLEGRPTPTAAERVQDAASGAWAGLTDEKLEAVFGPRRPHTVDWSKVKGFKP